MTESKRDRALAEGFSGRRAAEIVGITYRQLDYWARTDLVRPSLAEANGSGSRRQYSYRDLLELKVVKSLLDAGIRLESVREAFAYLREHLGEDIVTANLVIRGTSVLVRSDEEIVDVLRQGQGVLNILPLGGVKDEIDSAIVELRPFGETGTTPGADPVRRAVGSDS
jgi:DNA-binding transcriptional MerR regulator